MINKVAVVPVCCINTLAFVFLASDVTGYKRHIQGMKDSFLIRFKYCLTTRSLIALNGHAFMEFPDLHPEHQRLYCESYGRSIFSSIDVLRQELWRISVAILLGRKSWSGACIQTSCIKQFKAWECSLFFYLIRNRSWKHFKK
jgi:hypothetical protein